MKQDVKRLTHCDILSGFKCYQAHSEDSERLKTLFSHLEICVTLLELPIYTSM